jgi:hypothetical protein
MKVTKILNRPKLGLYPAVVHYTDNECQHGFIIRLQQQALRSKLTASYNKNCCWYYLPYCLSLVIVGHYITVYTFFLMFSLFSKPSIYSLFPYNYP